MSTMNTVTEGNLELVFSDEWRIVKWDEDDAFVSGIQTSLDGSKAVDVLARQTKASKLRFVEIKDFFESQPGDLKRIRKEIPKEVGIKVRDTISGLVGAGRRHPREAEWDHWLRRLADGSDIQVILWLEMPSAKSTATYEKRRKASLHPLRKNLQKRLAWLGGNVRVKIASLSEQPQGIAAQRIDRAQQ